MAEITKSTLHDATPSWNGFNYQGKVGLYICLKIILEQLNSVSIKDKEFEEFLRSYSIEYEWIEDVAIKKNGNYISLHQVKHMAGTNFSDYVEAVATILSRRLGCLSESDFLKYINLKFDFSNCDTPEKKKKQRDITIKEKFQLLIDKKYLTAERKLTSGWDENKTEISGIDQNQLRKLLSEFDSFTKETFKDSKIYFHTSVSISGPTKCISDYSGIPENIKNTIAGKKDLTEESIYFCFDDSEYELALSDSALQNKVNEIISEILKKIHSGTEFTENEYDLYTCSLLSLIDAHIVYRHENINGNNGFGFKEKKECLFFSDLYSLLKEVIRKQDDDYWKHFCRRKFEIAYSEKIDELNDKIRAYQGSESKNKKTINNLMKFKSHLFEKYSASEVIEWLSPNIECKNKEDYYTRIANEELLKNCFFTLFESIDEPKDDFYLYKDMKYKFHPSIITTINVKIHDLDYRLKTIKYLIKSNINKIMTVSHLIINCHEEHREIVNNTRVDILDNIDFIDREVTGDVYYQRNNNTINMMFIDANDAIEILNNE